MAVRETTALRCLATMRAVCQSPLVDRFRIGYTYQPIQKRSAPYRVTKWNHLVALADQMCRDDALDLEERLFIYMQGDKSDILYHKYDKLIRDGQYRRSAGGKTADADALRHGVYMAWCDEKPTPAVLRRIAQNAKAD